MFVAPETDTLEGEGWKAPEADAVEPGKFIAPSSDIAVESDEGKPIFRPVEPKMESTIAGGKPLSLPGAGEAASSLYETLAPEFQRSALEPVLPNAEIKPTDTVSVAVGKEAYNLAIGIPKFVASPMGVGAAAVGTVAPVATAAAFTVDMLHSLGTQILDSYKNWQEMTPGQKAGAVTGMVGTGALAGLLGAHTVKGVKAEFEPVTQPIADAGAPATAAATEKVLSGEDLTLPEVAEPIADLAKPINIEVAPATKAAVEEIIPAKPSEEVVSKPDQSTVQSGLDKPASERTTEEQAAVEANKKISTDMAESGKAYNDGYKSGLSHGEPIAGANSELLYRENLRKANDAVSNSATEPKIRDYWQGYLDAVKSKPPEQMAKELGVEVPKEPWQMTQDDFVRHYVESAWSKEMGKPTTYEEIQKLGMHNEAAMNALDVHYLNVEKALAEGKSVPAEVLAEYPELKPTPAATPGGVVGKELKHPDQMTDDELSSHVLVGRAKGENNPGYSLDDYLQKSLSDWVDKSQRLSPKEKDVAFDLVSDYIYENGMASIKGKSWSDLFNHVNASRKSISRASRTGLPIRIETKTTPPEPAKVDIVQKYRVGNNPTLHTLVEKLKASESEIANGEQPVRVRNDKTGEEQIVMESDLTPVKERVGDKTPKTTVDDKLKKLGYSETEIAAMPKAGKDALAKRGQPKIIGMGGAVPSEFVGKAQTELPILEQTIRQLASATEKTDASKDAYDIGKQTASIKDGVNDAVDGLKAVGLYLKDKLVGFPKWTAFKDVLGNRHLELTESVANAKRWVKSATKAIPSERLQEAISDYIDTGGSKELLKEAQSKTKERYKKGYELAQNLTPEQIKMAEWVKSYFEERLRDATEAGILEDGIENYIHRVYEKDTPWKSGVLAELRSGIFTGRPALAKQRAFEYDFEAEQQGLTPIKSFIKRVAAYDLALNKAIADRKAVKAMMEIKMPDGRPMVDVGGIGMEVPKGEATEATLIKPQFKPGDVDNPQNNRGDYQAKDYPALRKWKWVSKDASGNPIMVQGDVLIHPDAIAELKPLFERSKIRQSALGRAALGVSSTIKQTMLDLSGFHLAQITVHGWEHRSFKPVSEIDFGDNNVRGLIKGGLQVGDTRGYDTFSEGLSGSSLTKYIPKLGPKLHDWNQWLFESYIPRLKVSTGLHALERNRSRFPELSEEELYHLTANQMNAAFGELNYEMIGRSKTTQDVLRLALLAPDFLEARTRFVAQAVTGLKGYGKEQFTALALGAATLYMTSRIINKLLDGSYHFEPKNAFSVVYNNKAYSLRTVQGDLLHLFAEPGRFFFHRLNPTIGRPAIEAMTGRDAFGRKRNLAEQVEDFLATPVPISLRGGLDPREQNLWESFLNAFGITERRSTSIDTVFDLVKDWKTKTKVREEPGEFIYDREKDPFRAVRQASLFSSPETVADEIKKTVEKHNLTSAKIREHFQNYTFRPFSGSKKNESKFVASLSDDNKRIYEDAKKERKELWNKFKQGYEIYRQNK